RHRLGQVDLARGEDRLPQRELARPHHHHRGPGRVRAPAQELPDHPARGRRRHRVVGGGAQEHPAPGARRDPDRRDSRARGDGARGGLRRDRPPGARHAARQQLQPGDGPDHQLLPRGAPPAVADGPLAQPEGGDLAAPDPAARRQGPRRGGRGAAQLAADLGPDLQGRDPRDQGDHEEVARAGHADLRPGAVRPVRGRTHQLRGRAALRRLHQRGAPQHQAARQGNEGQGPHQGHRAPRYRLSDMHFTKKGRCGVLFCLWLALAGSVCAQAWPARPVRVIVAFSPGGVTDIIARTTAPKLAELWGQPVVVENRTGAGGSVGAMAVARAPADGYTLLVHSSGYALNTAINSSLPYDPRKDFVEVAPLASQPMVLVVGAAGPASVAELIAAARQRPGGVSYGSAGIGSGAHFNSEKFRIAAGIEVLHVPYKGGAEAIHDTIAGRISFTFNTVTLALPHIREGRLRVLAVSSAQRSSLLPGTPTVAESAIPGFEYTFWNGLWAPA